MTGRKRIEQPTTKSAIKKVLEKMTLKNKAELLNFTINYYGLHLEGELWKQIYKLEKK